ncbi:MAG: translation initiation factor IF-2 [Clostridiales Family XIII bacterium]|jgi:translation initiation factor IF-2|nr:translation initiation factor IF-2 [Clostridiales Family XIII bacterium]
MKIHEIATKLRLQNKDVLTKAAALGIEAKNHMVDLSDEDTETLINGLRGGGTAKGPKPAAKKAKPSVAAQEDSGVEADEPKPAVPKKAAPKKATPKRISKEEIEEELKKTDELADDEKKELAKKREKPVLKVAYKDTGKDADESKAEPPQRESEPAKSEPAAAAEVKQEAPPVKAVAEPEPKAEVKEAPAAAAKVEPKIAAVTETAPETKTEPVTRAKTEPASDAKPAQAPNAKQAPAPDTRPPQAPGATKEKPARDKKAKKPRPEKPADEKSKDEKPKGAAKKPDKPKYGAGQKQSGQDRRRGKAEDRAPKRKILEGSSLEKKPVRSRPRPKTQPKAGPEIDKILEDLPVGTKVINVPITVAGFAEQTEQTITDVIMTLMKLGVMANVNQNLDETTVQLLGEELGIPIYIGSDAGDIEEAGLEDVEDKEEDLVPRPPIITVMGHVDHGKTSLLDAIRKTNVTKGEAGGITQHIGASEVTVNGERIVFLDTPGHEAFTAMRARGAHVTDIAVLVVAADDGVMPQTIESISHARAAGVPIIVAINKMDKEGANPDRVKKELADNGVLVEDWGGDIISVPVSAKTGDGIVTLLEMILLQAEVLELRANPNRLAMGTVIEAYLDKARGAVATLLVLNGTLESGGSIVAGMASGRIRAMTDANGKKIRKAGPATAVEVTGLSEAPQGGDEFRAVRDDRVARDIAESRKLRQREEIMARTSGASLDTLFSQINANEMKELNLIIKGDVQGSVGALTASLEKLSNDEVKVRIIHRGVGAITESDVMLASTSNAIIIGFNVRPNAAVTSRAENDGVEIRTYRVIYDAIGDVESAMKGLLDPEFREVVLGSAEIRETFKVPGIGVIGGAYVTNGLIRRNAKARVIRDGIVIYEGNISSLKRFKEDAREVNQGFECGIGVENYGDLKVGDVIEDFVVEEIERE